MPTIRVMHILNIDSAIPEDRPVNVWHFQTAVDEEPYADLANTLQAFYNTLAGGMPGYVATNGHMIKMYDLADTKPRAPVYETTYNFTGSPPTGEGMASEICICVSFQGVRVSGQDQKRRRGRVYIGPFNESQNDDGRPASGFVTGVRDAAEDILEASNLATDWKWVVHSIVNNNNVVVDNGWVDNAWDIQRRRGVEATSRSVFVG